MSAVRLTQTRLHGGIWEGVLEVPDGGDPPGIEAVHHDMPLAAVDVRPDASQPGRFGVRVQLPPDLLSDGVQTVVIRDAATGETLQSIAILAGTALEADIRAELDLLRAELDMLKKAFRRHFAESSTDRGT